MYMYGATPETASVETVGMADGMLKSKSWILGLDLCESVVPFELRSAFLLPDSKDKGRGLVIS